MKLKLISTLMLMGLGAAANGARAEMVQSTERG